jgi:hypothetical protein
MLYFPYRSNKMTDRAVLQREINSLPPRYYGEVVDYVEYLRKKAQSQDDESAAYQAMAADTEREQEAREWCNAYFGPAASAKPVHTA